MNLNGFVTGVNSWLWHDLDEPFLQFTDFIAEWATLQRRCWASALQGFWGRLVPAVAPSVYLLINTHVT